MSNIENEMGGFAWMPTFVAFNSIENECVYIRQIGNKLQFFFLHAMKKRQWEENRKMEKKRKTFLILLCHSHELLIFNFSRSTLNERFYFISIPFLLQFSTNICALTYFVHSNTDYFSNFWWFIFNSLWYNFS